MREIANTAPPSPPPTQPSATPSPLSERDWDKLISRIGDGLVVPVIGPELLCVPWGEKPAARLYDLWGEALAQQREIEATSAPCETPLLYRIANHLSVDPSMHPGDLEYEINGVIRGQRWPLPESLRQLAEIRDFPLYITTTIDHLMLAAVCQTRETRNAPLQIVFNPRGNSLHNDLPNGFVPGEPPVVFHLFGATCRDPDGFAATEDQLIEFSWALIDQQYAPKRLYDFLCRKRILLLGCDFPDWLARFFIHALTRRPDARIVLQYVSGCSPPGGLDDFLRRKNADVLPPQSPVDFVAELHRRWQARRGTELRADAEHRHAPIPRESKPGSVFLSYAREDREAAVAIRAQLEAANIDIWMDERGLEPGTAFEEVIHRNIENASFFVAIISRALDLSDSDRPGRFVLKERHWAEEENLSRPQDPGFLQPVIVDDTPADASFITRPFRRANWTYLRDGKLPPEFIDFLRQGIRRFRRTLPRGVTR